jgi:mRNA interferase MazF
LVAAEWIPDVGDVIWVDLNPTVGHEQAGKRPALVLSPAAYNAKTSLLVACAMTSEVKGYPFEVTMPDGGIVLADQLKCLDWRMRNVERKDKAPTEVMAAVRSLLGKFLQITT